MRRTRIKICGITRAEDAIAAADAGADAIGMVFYAPAPRNVTIDRAKEILGVLPPFVSGVGLFVDAEVPGMLRLTDQLHLRHVQLHGQETPERVSELRGFRVIKAIRFTPESFTQELSRWREKAIELNLSHFNGIVLETGGTGAPGGTGVANDWDALIEHHRRGDFHNLPPIIAAGGLTPKTVGRVVREFRPWAVDVSSGVEKSIGVKSAGKIKDFVEAVRDADAEINGL